MSNLQPNCCLNFDFQKADQHAGGKWLIHDTKRRKDNQYFPVVLAAFNMPNSRYRIQLVLFWMWRHNGWALWRRGGGAWI